MTICIASLCRCGQAIVVASDRMVTAGFLSMEFEHPTSKIERLDDTCLALTAGDALIGTELFKTAARKDGCEVQAPPEDVQMLFSGWSVEALANDVAETFGDLRRRRAEETVLRPRGLTLETFYGGAMSQLLPDLAVALDTSIAQSSLPVEVVIAGIDDAGAHIYGVSDPGVTTCFDRIGYHAIGSGLPHALLAMIGNNQCADNGLSEAVYLVYEAKKRAEVAQGVGSATEMAIVTPEGIAFLSDEEKGVLDGIYRRKTNPGARRLKSAIAALPWDD